MNFSYHLPAVLIGGAVVLVQPQLAMALTPAQVSDIAKEFTVLIKGDLSGSGVIFERKGDTYSVITNRHVIAKEGRYEIQTPDGSTHMVSSTKEIPGLDLAVLDFKSDKNYRLAKLGNSDSINAGTTVYVVGWADGLPGINESSYYFTDGSIRSILENPDKGYSLVYSNEALPGMSGGPVLDEKAQVVGINGRAKTELRQDGTLLAVLRLGISTKNFLAARNRLLETAQATAPQTDTSQNLTTIAPQQLSAEEYISLGGAKAKRQDFHGAIANYTQALQIRPNNPDAHFRRGVAFNIVKDYQAALDDFNQLLRLSPKNAVAYANRGLVYINLKDYESAKADADQAIRLAPNSSVGYVIRGNARYHLKDYQGASADYDQVIRLGTDTNNVAIAYALRGNLRNQNEDYEGARADADQAIRLTDKYGISYLIRGIARYKLNDHQGAIGDFDQALRLNPDNGIVYALRGHILNQQKNYRGARADAEQVIRLAPQYDVGYLIRGIAKHKVKDYQGAIADYEQVIRLALIPTNVTIAEALLGENNQQPNSPQATISNFNKAVQNESNQATPDVIQSLIDDLQKDYSGTLASYEKALSLDAKSLLAVMQLGLIKYELQDTEGAIREFQTAVNINSKDAQPQLALAVALYAKGKDKQTQALEMAQTALSINNRLADLKYLKDSLWGDRLLADTQKLLTNPNIQKPISLPLPNQ